MGLIKDYPSDQMLTGGEKVIGSDVDDSTVNIEITQIKSYLLLDAAAIKVAYESNADTNAFTDALLTKLQGLEDNRFLGTYVSLAALQSANPSPAEGTYGYVDTGVGTDVNMYIWDNDDNDFVLSTGAGVADDAATIKIKYESNPDTNAFTDLDVSKLSDGDKGDIVITGAVYTLDTAISTAPSFLNGITLGTGISTGSDNAVLNLSQNDTLIQSRTTGGTSILGANADGDFFFQKRNNETKGNVFLFQNASTLRTITFPDKDFTVAGLDDVTGSLQNLDEVLAQGTDANNQNLTGIAILSVNNQNDGLNNWEVRSDLSGTYAGDLSFGNNTDVFAIPNDGTPSEDGHIINKAYADANYSGGGGATQLSELSDVSSSTATNRFVLVGNGTTFASRQLLEADISDLSNYVSLDPGFNTLTGTWSIGKDNIGITIDDDTDTVNISGGDGGTATILRVGPDEVSHTLTTSEINAIGNSAIPNVGWINDQGFGSGGSALEVEDEGVSLSTGVTKINFVGDAITATEPVADEITVTVNSSSLSTDNQNRILNENKTIEVLITSDRSITTEDVEISTGSDIGKKPFLTPDTNGNTRVLTLDDIGDTGDLLNFSGNVSQETAVLRVDEGTATIVNLSGDNNAFTVTDGEYAVLRKLGTNSYRIDGSYTELENVSDAILATSPLFYFNPDTIDVDAVNDGDSISGANAWTDASGNGYDATIGGGTFELNIDPAAGRQVRWSSSAWFDIPDNAALDLVPGTDEFTLIWRIGETVNADASGYTISKAPASSGLRTGAFFGSAGTYNDMLVGGTGTAMTPNTVSPNALAIVVIGTSTYDMWIDGTQVITGGTVGTGDPAGQSWNIGSRTDGSFVANAGLSMDLVALIPSAINTTQRQAIEAQFQIN